MTASLKLIPGGLAPEDQERENLIVELSLIEADPRRPTEERRKAMEQKYELIKQRPAYVVEKMEREQNLVR